VYFVKSRNTVRGQSELVSLQKQKAEDKTKKGRQGQKLCLKIPICKKLSQVALDETGLSDPVAATELSMQRKCYSNNTIL